MTDQSAGNTAPQTMDGAAFEAFRKRERGGVLTNASIGFMILMITTYAIFIGLYWSTLGEVAAWYVELLRTMPNMAQSGAAAEPPTPPMALFSLLPGSFLLLFVLYLSIAAYEAACLRWMVRGESTGLFFGLDLSADTWRIYLGYWLWFAGYFGAVFTIEFGTIIIGLIGGLIGAAVGQNNPAIGVLIGFAAGGLFLIGALGVYLWGVVRFAPAAATSIALKRFAFFDAWKVSRGRFWGLFWSFFLVIVMSFLTVAVVEGVGFAFVAVQYAQAAAGGGDAQHTIMQVLSRPLTIIVLLTLYAIAIASSFIFYLGMFGVNARAVMLARQEGALPAP